MFLVMSASGTCEQHSESSTVRDGCSARVREDRRIAGTILDPSSTNEPRRAGGPSRGWSTAWSSPAVRVSVAVLLVAATAVAMHLLDVNETTAASVFLVIVVLTALFRSPAGPVGLVLTCVFFELWFVPPVGHLTTRVEEEDIVPLLAFVIAAVVCGVVVARLDTMRRRAEEQEEAAFRAELDAAISENRAAFLSTMTHNLRTPLASIEAAAATLASPTASVSDDTRASLVGTIHHEADRLERLVTKVLELSRVHAGALEARVETTDVAELARAAVRTLRHVAGATEIHLDVDGDPLLADVDPDMLEVVLVSLLENSLRFAPPGTEVAVRAGADGGRCVIRVVDHGPGIAPDDRERMFDEFVQLDDVGGGAGAGLGLAIARAFVEAQSGTLTFEPTLGGGATFLVTVPLDRGGS